MSKLLFDESPLVVQPTLAKAIGLNEAIVLQQVNYWMNNKNTGKIINGRKWIYNTVKEWQEQFPFWSDETIKRVIYSLQDARLIESGNFNKSKMDRTKWYTINFETVALLEALIAQEKELEVETQSNTPEWNDASCHFDTMDVSFCYDIPETTSESTTKNCTASNEADARCAHPLQENTTEGEVQNSPKEAAFSPQKENAPAAPPPARPPREIDPALLPETEDELYLFEQINVARAARHLKGKCRAFQTPQQRELFRENNAYFNGSTRKEIDAQLARGKFDVRSILNGLDYKRRTPPRAPQAFGKPQYDQNNLPPIPPHVMAKQGRKVFQDGQWFSIPE